MPDGDKPQTTRELILEAGRRTFEKLGIHASMAQIAEAAGVSRQTLYLQFGDRVGVLRELVNYTASREPNIGAMLAAVDSPPLEAFESFFRHWIRGSFKVEPTLRSYWRVAENDPELMDAVRRSDQEFLDHYVKLFARLHKARLLKPIWSAREAAEAAYLTTAYGVFVGHLRNMRDWTPEDIEERGMKVLRSTFLTDRAARKAETIEVPVIRRPPPKGRKRPSDSA